MNRATSQTLRTQAAQEGLVPLKAWVKAVLDRVIGVCFGSTDCEFSWVGDDAVDPLQQAQTIAILVGAGAKTIAEARAELGLGSGAGVVKYNPFHDERGRFTTADGAVEPGTDTQARPDRGVEVAENEYGPVSDISFAVPSSQSDPSNTPDIQQVREITHHQHEAPMDSVPMQAGDGRAFLAPPKADFATVLSAGKAEGLMGVRSYLGWWGKFDFQRDGDSFIHPYTDASNYAVGVYLAGAGYTWSETYLIASTFAHTMSSNAGSQAQEAWWARGWNDATNKTGPFSN